MAQKLLLNSLLKAMDTRQKLIVEHTAEVERLQNSILQIISNDQDVMPVGDSLLECVLNLRKAVTTKLERATSQAEREYHIIVLHQLGDLEERLTR